MTEDEFNRSSDPRQMLELLSAQGTLSERKARLFAVACCRHIWPLLTDERYRMAVEVAERCADGGGTSTDLRQALRGVGEACRDLGNAFHHNFTALSAFGVCSREPIEAAWKAATYMPLAGPRVIGLAPGLPDNEYTGDRDGGNAAACVLLKDIFGPPWRPSPLPTSVLPWNDGTMVRLAWAAYENRNLPEGTLDIPRLAVLADALEEAGCDNAEILSHLRSPGPHVRGCFALDLLLGKE
jgi:hypothetical protein